MCFYKVKRRIVHTFMPMEDVWHKSRAEILMTFHILTHPTRIEPVISFATRPMRDGEMNGREHWFITPEEAKQKLETEQVLAYTKISKDGISGYEYFTTVEGLKGANFYVIDPNGVQYIKDHTPDLHCKVIYVSIPDDVRTERASHRSDFSTAFQKRNEDEDAQFTEFETRKAWDLHIENLDLDDSLEQFFEFFIRTYTKDTMYLVVGRTGSGKDTLIHSARNMLLG